MQFWKITPLMMFVCFPTVVAVMAQVAVTSPAIDPDDIGGVVTSSNGAEVGVWVVGETTDLATKFRKIAVTDDAGRFVIPDLPEAKYKVWVRGYGLVDSQPIETNRGKNLAMKAVLAPNPRAA